MPVYFKTNSGTFKYLTLLMLGSKSHQFFHIDFELLNWEFSEENNILELVMEHFHCYCYLAYQYSVPISVLNSAITAYVI